MILTIIGMIAAFVVAWALHPGDTTVVVEEEDRDEWFVTVEPTEDKCVYRGVYEAPTGNRYEFEGRGITNTLKGLANEIDRR